MWSSSSSSFTLLTPLKAKMRKGTLLPEASGNGRLRTTRTFRQREKHVVLPWWKSKHPSSPSWGTAANWVGRLLQSWRREQWPLGLMTRRAEQITNNARADLSCWFLCTRKQCPCVKLRLCSLLVVACLIIRSIVLLMACWLCVGNQIICLRLQL